jgi:hypothetical protein
MPNRSAAPKRIEWTNTSAVSMSFRSAARAFGCFKSRTTERLLRLRLRKYEPMAGLRASPMWRVVSPSGASTLITSAPMSPRICVQDGPRTLLVRSTTLSPASGPCAAPASCTSSRRIDVFPAALSGCLHDRVPERRSHEEPSAPQAQRCRPGGRPSRGTRAQSASRIPAIDDELSAGDER